MPARQSAGILLFRRSAAVAEVLLAHPGGPFFTTRDIGHWTIPKGEPDPDETDLLAVARREFLEEVGCEAGASPAYGASPANGAPANEPISLGTIVQKGGKVVHAWAVEGDVDPATAVSNTFEMEWPPRSGRRQVFPEIDRVDWFTADEARRRLKPTQIPFVDRLMEALAPGGDGGDGTSVVAAATARAAKPDGS